VWHSLKCFSVWWGVLSSEVWWQSARKDKGKPKAKLFSLFISPFPYLGLRCVLVLQSLEPFMNDLGTIFHQHFGLDPLVAVLAIAMARSPPRSFRLLDETPATVDGTAQ